MSRYAHCMADVNEANRTKRFAKKKRSAQHQGTHQKKATVVNCQKVE